MVLQWIPSHCTIARNEAAHDLGKKGAQLHHTPHQPSEAKYRDSNTSRIQITYQKKMVIEIRETQWKYAIKSIQNILMLSLFGY